MAVLYSEKRSEIKTGDLLAWKITKINSFFDLVLFLYQKIFKAKYTHVAIAFKEGNRLFILEATPPEVRLFPVSMTDDFYLFSLNLNIDSSHIDIILRKLGIKYGLCDLIRSILKLSDNKKEEYCSELASKFYNEIGFINDKEAGFTPDTIVEAIQREHDIEPILVKIDRNNLSGV